MGATSFCATRNVTSQHYKYLVYMRDFKIYALFMKGFLQGGKPGHSAVPVLSSMTETSQFISNNGYYWVSNSHSGLNKFTLENPTLEKCNRSAEGADPRCGISVRDRLWLPLPAPLIETSNNSACTLVYARFVELMIKLGAAENTNPQKKFSEKHANWIQVVVAAMMIVFNLQCLLIVYGKG